MLKFIKNNMINLPTILKSVTDSLWKWISNVKTLNYHAIVKNFIVAILIFIVYFFFVHMEALTAIPSITLSIIGGLLLLFIAIQYVSESKSQNKVMLKEQRLLESKEKLSDELDAAMEKALYRLKCSRIMVHSLHNGTRSFGGIPFKRMSVIKETVNLDANVDYLAEAYQNQLLSLYKFPSLLNKKEYMCLTYEKLKEIDNRYACQMKMSGDNVFIAVPLRSAHGLQIGMVTFGWKDNDDMPISHSKLRNEILNVCSLAKSLLIVK